MEGFDCESLNSLLEHYKIYLVDQKGKLDIVKLSFDFKNAELKIQKHQNSNPIPDPYCSHSVTGNEFNETEISVDANNFDIYSNSIPESPKFDNKSSTYGKPNKFFRSLRRERRSNTKRDIAITQNLNYHEKINAFQIQEIRLSKYNPKTSTVNPADLKKLKLTGSTGSFRSGQIKLRELKVFFGKEFNLQCHHFVVTYTEKANNQHQNVRVKDAPHLETWMIKILEFLMHEEKYVSYFEKLNRWYINEYAITELKTVSLQRRDIWRQFLDRNHDGRSVEIVEENLRFLDSILKEYLGYTENKHFEINEFLLLAKYFVHNNDIIIRILEDKAGHNNKAADETLKMLQCYFSYFSKYKKNFMSVSYANIETLPNQRTLTIKEIVGKIDSLKLTGQLIEEKWFSSYYILDYLYSNYNSIWLPERLKKYQDMKQPLSHYFIASSHNTYLTGNQVNSKSSCECYARVLRQGCRCIEIDVWNGPENKPIVKHGNTMTSSLKLKDVLTTIKEHAFMSSKYPVIISIENHCDIQQQKIMAKYITKVFGDVLCTTLEFDSVIGLPSPEQLKNRIILKGDSLPKCEKKNSFKENIYGGLQRLNPGSESAENRNNVDTDSFDDSPFIEPNGSEYLLAGELYVESNYQSWEPQIFLLNSEAMICIEEQSYKSRVNRKIQMSWFPVRRSMSMIDLSQSFHEDQVWFHGNVPGEYNEVNELLRKSSMEGSFLVWESTKTAHIFILSFYYQNIDAHKDFKNTNADVHHIPIQIRKLNQKKSELKYFLYEYSVKLNSIYDLVSYYLRNPLPTKTFSLKHLGSPVEACVQNSHEHMEWFYKDMDQDKSEMVLSKFNITGLFLGRYKDDTHAEIVISFRYGNQVKHCCVKRQGGFLAIANIKFRTLEGLVEYYGIKKFYKDVKLVQPLPIGLYNKAINNEIVDDSVYISPEQTNSLKASPELVKSSLGKPESDMIEKTDKDSTPIQQKDRPRNLKRFKPSFTEERDDLNCPFPDYVRLFKWKLGIKATVKPCTNKHALKEGLTYYIIFEDDNGLKRKLGTTCSIVANEWVQTINSVLGNNQETKVEKSKTHRVAAELSDLIMLPKMKAKITPENLNKLMVDVRNNVDAKYNGETSVKSFSESMAESSFSSHSKIWPLYHQHFLTRIYPKLLHGTRWISSNFNPVFFWNFGSQLVALNYQTPDKGMQINRGLFKQNGNIGYVLKPHYLLTEPFPHEEFLFDPTDITQVKFKTILTIEVIGARHLQKHVPEQIRPVVEIEIFGVDADNSKVKTTRQETGLNPFWNESFEFHIHYTELALIQFRVYDEDVLNDRLFLGEATIPVSCIRQGYRCVELSNEYGFQWLSRLLVKLKINEYEL